jgi:hypothetical protein
VANQEKGLKRYRVYRRETRISGPDQAVTRLTADPVAAEGCADLKAGKETRRYWVVAVDVGWRYLTGEDGGGLLDA